MTDLRARIRQKLLSEPTIVEMAEDRVQDFAADPVVGETLPRVDFARVAGKTDTFGMRQETYLVSAWAEQSDGDAGAERLSRAVIGLFNRSRDEEYRYARMANIADERDADTGACGIRMTFVFTVCDREF